MIAAPLPRQSGTTDDCGWQASLELAFAQHGSSTVLEHSRHYGPLRVQRPFYPEGNLAHVYILHPPGGVVGGDRLSISLDVTDGAQVLSTTPGSGKFYSSAGKPAHLEQHLRIGPGSTLEWLPQENILFDGAHLRADTRIDLEDDAVFIGWDITCLGRPASHERFEHGTLSSRLTLYHNRELQLVESQRVFNKQALNAAAGLRGKPVQGILLAFPCNPSHLQCVRDSLAERVPSRLTGATLIDRLLVVRTLGDDSERLKQNMMTLWRELRPRLLERPAVSPRIWAT